jgi:hypothetical protein
VQDPTQCKTDIPEISSGFKRDTKLCVCFVKYYGISYNNYRTCVVKKTAVHKATLWGSVGQLTGEKGSDLGQVAVSGIDELRFIHTVITTLLTLVALSLEMCPVYGTIRRWVLPSHPPLNVQSFSGALAELRKATISFVMSVRPNVTAVLPLDGF